MELLVKEPVKEAVREVLAEERVSGGDRSYELVGSDRKSEDEGGRSGSWLMLVLFASVAGAVYYATRLRGRGGAGDVSDQIPPSDAGEPVDTGFDPSTGTSRSDEESTREEMNQ